MSLSLQKYELRGNRVLVNINEFVRTQLTHNYKTYHTHHTHRQCVLWVISTFFLCWVTVTEYLGIGASNGLAALDDSSLKPKF